MRYIRTFFTALKMTAQGEAITETPTRYPNLQVWLQASQQKLDTVYKVAESAGLDKAKREAFTLQLDGRTWSMELILSSVKFHLEMEFPSLMSKEIDHNLTTLYALHFDDKYRVAQLAQSDQLPTEVKHAVQAFSTQLNDIPPSNDA